MTVQKDTAKDGQFQTEADATKAMAQAKMSHVQKVINRIRAAKAKREALKRAKPELNQ